MKPQENKPNRSGSLSGRSRAVDNAPNQFGPLSSRDAGAVDRFGPIHDRDKLFPQRPTEVGEGLRSSGYGNSRIISAEDKIEEAVPAVEAAASTCSYAWTPTKTGNSGGNDQLVLNVGSVSGATTKIGGVDILTNPTLEVPDTADTTQIVYLTIPVTKIKTANDFVYGCTITGGVATVNVATTLPTPNTQDDRYHELFRWRNGVLFNQVGKYNVAVYCRDDGTSTGVGVFTILTAG